LKKSNVKGVPLAGRPLGNEASFSHHYRASEATMSDRKGSWIQTFTGRQFWPLDPDPDDIDIRDIAHALSMKCRYGGHCIKFYSVAEHSILVSRNCYKHRMEALLHDAAEAYLCDLPSPVKPHIVGFKGIETAVEAAIAERFGLSYPWSWEVHDVDKRILIDEAFWNMVEGPEWGAHPSGALGLASLPCWEPAMAERMFLEVFEQLGDM
jgi:hypothetical protein